MGPRFFTWALLLLAAIATIWALAVNKTDPTEPSVMVHGQVLAVEIADTAALRTQGLSGRSTLPENSSMLFVFDETGEHCFWMRDMNFAIDMIWLTTRGRVVHLEERVTPETYPKAFCPDKNARYVLEVNAGVAEQLGISEGTRLDLRL